MTIAKALWSSAKDEYITPRWLFEKYDEIFHFTLDACTSKDNPMRVEKFFTKEDDGLSHPWTCRNGSVWVNPPYGRNIVKWIKKAVDQVNRNFCYRVVMLLPARTDTKWFHEYIYRKENVELILLKGRLKFEGTKTSAPFPSMIAIIHD